MNLNDHKKVRALLESEHALDRKTEVALQAHLYNCADCRVYAEMLTQLKSGSWNPFPRLRLTQTESQKIVRQIRPHLRQDKMVRKTGFFYLSSALGLIGLLVIVGLFAFTIAQLNQTAASPATPLAESDSTTPSYVSYDGWEAGVAFQFPATWTITNFDTDNGPIIMFATPLDETAAPCTPFLASDATNAAAWIVPFDPTIPLTPLEFLDRFVEFDELSVQETPQAVTVNGHPAAYTRGEIPCEEPFNQITIMTGETNTHHVLLSTRHAASGAEAARTELEAIITSLTPVDYTGWQPWEPNEFRFTVMAPVGWNVFDGGKSLEVTPNNQPAWSSIADPNQPANAPRLVIYHNLNSQFGETPLGIVKQRITQMRVDLAMQQVNPPTEHPLVPGLVTAVYTTEDTAIFFGAIAYPRDAIQLDPISATATVPLDQLESFRPTFESILRSLNGYYAAIADTPVRAALTGSGTAIPPTSTPIALTSPTSDDGKFATPTAVGSPTTTPTPTPFDPSATPPFFTPTPTPPTLSPTPTPYDPTATPPFFTPTPTPPTQVPTNFPSTSPTPTPYTPTPEPPTPTPTPPTPTPTPLPPTATPAPFPSPTP